jgi:hypothetical protein
MDCSLTDSAYNTMDLKHPEFVHNKLVGFGNTIPPTNIKHYNFNLNNVSRIGLSFDYFSNEIMKKINGGIQKTSNFHMYMYPTFSWSKVSFLENNLIIGVNLLPIDKKKTRWYITICHNYYRSEFGKKFMKMLAHAILKQDYVQMKNQYNENKLKNLILFNHMFSDENPIMELNRLFKDYKYPDIDECVELYNDYNSRL